MVGLGVLGGVRRPRGAGWVLVVRGTLASGVVVLRLLALLVVEASAREAPAPPPHPLLHLVDEARIGNCLPIRVHSESMLETCRPIGPGHMTVDHFGKARFHTHCAPVRCPD